MSPTKKELTAGEFLKSLFDFPTNVSFHIYDYGERTCNITIEADGEIYPHVHCASADADHLRGPNSIIVAKFAREFLKKLGVQYYCARKGFTIPYEKVLKLRDLKN